MPQQTHGREKAVVRCLAISSVGLLFYFRLVSMLYVAFFIKNFSEFFKDFFINLQIFFTDAKSGRKKTRKAMIEGEIDSAQEGSRGSEAAAGIGYEEGREQAFFAVFQAGSARD